MAVMAAYETAEETWGGPLEALGLAIAVLKKTKARSWAELCATTPGTPTAKLLAGIDLSPGQLSVLEFHRDVVSLLRVTPNAIPAICPVCELPTLVDAAAPTTCTMSLRCTGKPVKPAVAKKVDTAPTRPPLTTTEQDAVEQESEQFNEPASSLPEPVGNEPALNREPDDFLEDFNLDAVFTPQPADSEPEPQTEILLDVDEF